MIEAVLELLEELLLFSLFVSCLTMISVEMYLISTRGLKLPFVTIITILVILLVIIINSLIIGG